MAKAVRFREAQTLEYEYFCLLTFLSCNTSFWQALGHDAEQTVLKSRRTRGSKEIDWLCQSVEVFHSTNILNVSLP
jgi:hypothetical protein